MRIFNRIVVILLLAGLFVLGVYAVAYAFNLFGRSLDSLLGPIKSFGTRAQDFMSGVESGNLPALTILLLVLIALLGLILLIFELKPPAPRRVRMDKGTFVTRGVVQEEVSKAVEQTPDVLGHSVKAKARRSPGAQVDVRAQVRQGEDTGAIQRSLRRQVQEHLGGRGLPVGKLNVKTVEADPRQTKTRVQ
ncbi:MAG TPA: hypothetical protein VGR18_02405 [Rubrobacter sp.]|nr:hypothetical protein [Rubrobacter sp.]